VFEKLNSFTGLPLVSDQTAALPDRYIQPHQMTGLENIFILFIIVK